ncbi:MAG: aminotransferase class I/II-fold pyridoxal phosphate-dependent enzyme [Rhodospirillales bacterium]|jgi:histidinol-phosphate aminotransferase|nr:aminotransferase class I/II-fold pyridoxal phosphate-dependent enzyme [Rhodospirillales bacterium]MBT4038447.1 aminotransferase class I/II-fold pyridoxal phosphate-dependent enzyme [Rhodospirillales bacterium]MBT4627906.1 aminotransferase class I/II-fold pyridoxal phosphate-dependent enzyme [Rhodospirillales bacterium]MBT5351528.1 aminotransferase class I/II-fold pyridoxal phosphate-dependent enzyme [Rhodospirillales bacterium]MBT5520013.1 aminotransferase class I/II-fold pyridoxal phosphate
MTIQSKPGLKEIGYYMVGISKLPGFDQPIKLSSNESALGMSPKAIDAARDAAAGAHLYPEVDTDRLAVALGDKFGLEPDRMVFGPGSDELLQRIINTFVGPGEELIHSKNAYMQFPIYAKLAGATPVAAEDQDFHYDVDAILGCVTDRTRIVLVANPDNPSGTHLSAVEMRRLHAGLPENVLLIIDAAYEEFALIDDYESGTALVHQFDNVIVTRTFSKVYGMAGLRLGWCYGPAWVADLLTKIGPSFPINVVAQEAGLASVLDNDHMQAVLKHTTMWITKFSEALRGMGLIVYPSQTNFVLVRFPPECGKTSAEVNTYLNENGIIPRQFAVDAFGDKLRFTIGRDDEMEKTIQVLGEFLT